MKFFRMCSTALVLLLGAVIAHAQGFQNESFTPGAGKPELQYHLLVPEGVTVTNKKGEVFKGGQIIMVPWFQCHDPGVGLRQAHMKDPAFQSSFMNEKQYVGIPEEKCRITRSSR